MAYVPGFENDIFISYARPDNSEGWVDNCQRRLASRLRQFDSNNAVTIWRDFSLGGDRDNADVVYERLKASAILISILSPNGLASEFCEEERRGFEHAASATGGFRLPDHKIRAVKVVKTPAKDDKHRAVFGTLGFEFYERSQSPGGFREFQEASEEFAERLEEVAQEVWVLLNSLTSRGHNRSEELAPLPDRGVGFVREESHVSQERLPSGATGSRIIGARANVFVSAKSDDFNAAKQVYDYLVSQGLNVFFSDKSLPSLGNSDYRHEIDRALEESTHMVVVTTSRQNVEAPWVEAEWGFFINEKRSNRKSGNLVTVVSGGLKPRDLPPSLRYYEVLDCDPGGFERLIRYLKPENGL